MTNEDIHEGINAFDDLLDFAIHISTSDALMKQGLDTINNVVAWECELLACLARALPEVTHEGSTLDYKSATTIKALWGRESAKRLEMINEMHQALVQREVDSHVLQLRLLNEVERREEKS
jgi:hypothetical protein